MNDVRYRIVRTLRCKNLNVPGTLGKLTSAIGQAGVEIGNISTVHLGHHYTVRDIDVLVATEAALQVLIDRVSELPEVTILEVRDEVLELHKGGKIKVVSKTPIDSLDKLRKVYTPGVAEVCRLIVERPERKDHYTCIPYTIAIVTDGTAILGLGNIGPVAGMPVMEGKAALLQQLVGVNGVPILLDTTDTEEIVTTIKHISPTFGGIHLEDFASPRCFTLLERLENELDVPVFHDDQQGTAVVTLAALLNACKRTGKNLAETKIGLLGLGAAGLTIGKFILRYTGKPALGTARTEASNQRHAAAGGTPSNFDEIMAKADIVIGTTGVSGLIPPHAVRKGQIIFALSNPFPEISPDQAVAAGAVLATDGRTVNNLLGYPGIWRGTLDAKARRITWEMYEAAIHAIAAATGEGELVPNPLDPQAHLNVAHAVARAAMVSGVAQRKLDDDYFESTRLELPPEV
ncbi:MAG: malic enzyme-like NAD(P)-binding protein [Dehalococcoidia bacterium]|nr:malic enzyme-like NAD(P)-binding protein [Dehalococcoidia bacterium]